MFEELDSPGEFFYDKKASKLYLFHNASDGSLTPPPATTTAVASQQPVLLNVSGTQADPVKGVSFDGIK